MFSSISTRQEAGEAARAGADIVQGLRARQRAVLVENPMGGLLPGESGAHLFQCRGAS